MGPSAMWALRPVPLQLQKEPSRARKGIIEEISESPFTLLFIFLPNSILPEPPSIGLDLSSFPCSSSPISVYVTTMYIALLAPDLPSLEVVYSNLYPNRAIL
jgi:hypothetical protein